MVTQQILDGRAKEKQTIDEVTTIIWTHEMGQRMALARMKMLKEQKEIAREFGVTQSTISRIEIGHLKVCEKITVAAAKKVFGVFFAFVVFGANPERFNGGVITKGYWDTRLRVRRKNRGEFSKPRFV
jgi:transcriptional regulator with XRE-family HTH domain